MQEAYKKYIDSFDKPKDDIDRTYYQYKCIRDVYYKDSIIKKIVLNIISYFVIIGLLVVYSVNKLLIYKDNKVNAVFIDSDSRESGSYSYTGIFPEELKKEFVDIKYLHFNKYPALSTGIVDKKAFLFWINIFKRYPYAGLMNLLCFVHIMSANKIIHEYYPKAVINYRMEFNWASSVLTMFYESCNIEHINFMHGDYIIDIRRAFVRFSRCYIFDEHYKAVFDWSRSPKEQFRVYTPPMYKESLPQIKPEKVFLAYYFSGEEGNLEDLAKILVYLSDIGKTIKVRPHPRYSDYQLISEAFDNSSVIIEDTKKVTIQDSLAESRLIAARRSTVLTQAFYAGKEIVIDDISIPEIYKEMKNNMDIMYNKKHKRLSEFWGV